MKSRSLACMSALAARTWLVPLTYRRAFFRIFAIPARGGGIHLWGRPPGRCRRTACSAPPLKVRPGWVVRVCLASSTRSLSEVVKRHPSIGQVGLNSKARCWRRACSSSWGGENSRWGGKYALPARAGHALVPMPTDKFRQGLGLGRGCTPLSGGSLTGA